MGWDLYVPWATMAYNSSQQNSTGHTPYYLMFGREMEYSLGLVLKDPNKTTRLDLNDWIADLKSRLEAVFNHAQN